MNYNLFFWIHTVSYIIWVLAIAGSIFYRYQAKQAADDNIRLAHMLKERKANSWGAHIGSVGILLSGGAMVSIPTGPQWGWFNFTFGWLAAKQIIFAIILILVVFSAISSTRFKKQARNFEGEKITDELRNRWNKAFRWSLSIYILVIVNVILGHFRVF